MVIKLDLPPHSGEALVNLVVAERANGINAGFFAGIAAEWVARVVAYQVHSGSPEFVPQWQDIEHKKGSFLNLYLSPGEGSAQASVLDALRAHDLEFCPACGEPGRPNTLDHFLPKGKYPHLCITPANLFPMCDACQLKKGNKTGDAAQPRFFIHPYFDAFAAAQILTLVIHPPFETPTFDLLPREGLSQDDHALVTAHLRELCIVDRYAHFFRGQHRRLLRLVDKMRATGQNVQANLDMFKFGFEQPSPNAWEHLFYDAVLTNAAFVDYLENQPLPPYP